jgi:ABC-2 type transport system ATP-binding protein
MTAEKAIAVENLAKRYGRGARQVQALAGVSITVRQGEIYGLLGRNGAGKTTLVKILLDIVRATSGAAWILGEPSRSPASRWRAGYLPEDHRLTEYRTGEAALHFYAALSGVPRSERRKRIPALLELVGLEDAARRKVRAYSKGMKQRLGLAQAMVHDPRVLFLDEPTDGVDPVGRAQIRDILVTLKEEGRTIFLNSHLLSEVERVCDRVGILEQGRLVREGTLEDLTRTKLSFQIRTLPALDEGARAELARFAVSLEARADGFELGLEKEEDIDRAVDILRARGLSIRSLSGTKLSLEEVFLQAVEESAEAGAAKRDKGVTAS